MKSKIIIGIVSLLLVLPLTGQANAFDMYIANYIKSLNAKITALEKENEQLKNTCNVGKTVMITKKKKASKPIFATVTVGAKTQDSDGYSIELEVKGDYDTAKVMVQDKTGYVLASLQFTKNDTLKLNALQEGIYTYSVYAKKGTENSYLSGKFEI